MMNRLLLPLLALSAAAVSFTGCEAPPTGETAPSPEIAASASGNQEAERVRDLYLNTMKLSLTDLIYEHDPDKSEVRKIGYDWPSKAFTMIGLDRLENIRFCIEEVLKNDVPGDVIECGAWRGGATIFMRAVLDSYGESERNVWVADSFEGLPPPSEEFPADAGSTLHEDEELAVSLETVQRNFERYELFGDNVKFLKGWFSDTLPDAPIEKLAVLRADADMYESTMDVLVNLYDKVSPGGYIIIDDYLLIESCRKAVDDFREERGITDEIVKVDWNAVYWKKS